MLTGTLWLVEFILEGSGAILARRRGLKSLAILLGFRAGADILQFGVLLALGGNAYGVAAWACEAIQYALLCFLVVDLVKHMARDYQRVAPYACALAAILGCIVGFVAGDAHTLAGKLTAAEISASCGLCLVLVLAWITRKESLSRQLGLMAAGVVISVAGNALCAGLWHSWPVAAKLYPIPAIAALGIWCWTLARPVQIKLRSWAVRPMEMK